MPVRGSLTVEKIADEHHLRDDNGRYAIAELLVQGFVMPCFHTCPGSNAAADDGHSQQRGLSDAPFVSPGFPFVDAVCEECHHVDGGEVDQCDVQDARFFHAFK